MPVDTTAAIRATLGIRLRVARQNAGLTQRTLAARLADAGYTVTAQAISQWELGHTTPTLPMQAAVARALNTTHASLFGLDRLEATA